MKKNVMWDSRVLDLLHSQGGTSAARKFLNSSDMEEFKMLVQMKFSEVEGYDLNKYVGTAYCALCHKEIGNLTADELAHLVYGTWASDILCFSCEDIMPAPTRPFSKAEIKTLFRLFQVDDPLKLPVHAACAWQNTDAEAYLQLFPSRGWSLWFPNPDGSQRLRTASLAPSRVKEWIDQFEMYPRMLTGRTLV
jgi:hypothetical protein